MGLNSKCWLWHSFVFVLGGLQNYYSTNLFDLV